MLAFLGPSWSTARRALTDGTPTTAFVGGVGGGDAATIRAITCGGV
ncbi:hypothetical protein [Curtobacterium sp. MCBD17_013]|nr:hypothetical protein [Curtobacterium sp. MCBD17_013]